MAYFISTAASLNGPFTNCVALFWTILLLVHCVHPHLKHWRGVALHYVRCLRNSTPTWHSHYPLDWSWHRHYSGNYTTNHELYLQIKVKPNVTDLIKQCSRCMKSLELSSTDTNVWILDRIVRYDSFRFNTNSNNCTLIVSLQLIMLLWTVYT